MIFRKLFSSFTRAAVLAAIVSFASITQAIILYRTGDTTANTTAPTGAYANSGWQYEGTFGNFLATPIAPHFIITAQHIGTAPKFVFRGTNYTLVKSFDDPGSDLRIWQVAETLPVNAPLYSDHAEVGQHIVVIGRGTRRGTAHNVGGQLRGWDWGASDTVQRWGENQVASIQLRNSRECLYSLFEQAGLPQEATLSTGDSGGGVYLNDSGVWKLAGINFDVDTFASGSDGGGPYNAAIFDQRGLYTANGALVAGDAPVPAGFYSTRISARVDWISSIITPHLANISTRAAVGEGEQVCIAGFIVQGAAGDTKRVIVRGLGPSLQTSDGPIPGRMNDPYLELHDATGAIVSSNDDWASAQADEIQAAGLAPTEPKEAAIIATLAPGAYTTILRDATEAPGTGLIEVYDLDPTGSARVLNLSTRAFVGTDAQALIGGLIVRTTSSRLLVRALGPDLAASGVASALANPTLELHDVNGALIAFSDDWRSASNASDIAATGLAPSNDLDPAILLSAPGANTYTAVVHGADNTTGVALLEAYLLP